MAGLIRKLRETESEKGERGETRERNKLEQVRTK
jgi:hypothetical protein